MSHTADVLEAQFDHYSILGVAEGATSEEIKLAYRVCCKRHHPDRFAGSADPAAQALATAHMSRINLAYATLNDPEQRHLYDHQRRCAASAQFPARYRRPQRQHEEHGHAPGLDQLRQRFSGHRSPYAGAPVGNCLFSDLSPSRQDRLRKLRKRGPHQFRLKHGGCGRVLLLMLLLLVLLAGALSLAAVWADPMKGWGIASAAAMLCGASIGGCAFRLIRLARSDLGILHVFNPLYFVRANGEDVTWYRLADVTSFRAGRRVSALPFTTLALEMDLPGHTLVVRVRGRRRLARLLRTLRQWKSTARIADEERDFAYFERHGIFAGLSDHRPSRRLLSHRRRRLVCCLVAGALLSLLATTGAYAFDQVRPAAAPRFLEHLSKCIQLTLPG